MTTKTIYSYWVWTQLKLTQFSISALNLLFISKSDFKWLRQPRNTKHIKNKLTTRLQSKLLSLELGKTLDSNTSMSLGCCWKSSTPSQIGLSGVMATKVLDRLIFVRKAYIPNFRPLVPFLHVEKFLVGVYVDFSVKL